MCPLRNCPKDAFPTWTDAVKVAKRMERAQRIQGRDIRGQEPYRCGDHFHLTSHSYDKRRKTA